MVLYALLKNTRAYLEQTYFGGLKFLSYEQEDKFKKITFPMIPKLPDIFQPSLLFIVTAFRKWGMDGSSTKLKEISKMLPMGEEKITVS